MGQVAQIPCGHCRTLNDTTNQFCANCGYLPASGPTGTIPVISNPNTPSVIATSGRRITGTLAQKDLLSGRSRTVEMIGKGGFGAVYKAVECNAYKERPS